MKLVLLIVSFITVLTADCWELPGGLEDHGSADNTVKYTDEPMDHNILEDEHQLKMRKANNKRDVRRVGCKARNACVVMGGFCVTNATLCSGRLVAEGCKGVNCQCCVPGTLELKIQSLETELQSMRNNLNDTNEELKRDIQSMQSNNTNGNSNLNFELQSIKHNITGGNSNLDRKLDAIESAISNQDARLNTLNEHQDCFLVSYQCFRLYMDVQRSWDDAKAKCESEGLRLAEPTDSIAAALRRQVLYVFGDAQAWVGARGDGSRLVWQKRRNYLEKESTLLDSGRGSTTQMSSSYCLELDVLKSQHDAHYSTPYDVMSCTYRHWTLCEVVKGLVN